MSFVVFGRYMACRDPGTGERAAKLFVKMTRTANAKGIVWEGFSEANWHYPQITPLRNEEGTGKSEADKSAIQQVSTHTPAKVQDVPLAHPSRVSMILLDFLPGFIMTQTTGWIQLLDLIGHSCHRAITVSTSHSFYTTTEPGIGLRSTSFSTAAGQKMVSRSFSTETAVEPWTESSESLPQNGLARPKTEQGPRKRGAIPRESFWNAFPFAVGDEDEEDEDEKEERTNEMVRAWMAQARCSPLSTSAFSNPS